MEPTFADWLEEEINKRGWSRAELSRRSGISAPQISRLLNREQNPGKESIDSIARALHLPQETVYRAAGHLFPVDPIDEEAAQMLHVFKSLSPRDRAEMQALAEVKLKQAELELERQRAAKRIKTGPLPRLGG
jgi:transcriptional regulator with XRE-family HTH domain